MRNWSVCGGIVNETRSEAEKARQIAEAEARERMTAQERARKESADRAVWEQLAGEAEHAKAALAVQLQELQSAAAQSTPQDDSQVCGPSGSRRSGYQY